MAETISAVQIRAYTDLVLMRAQQIESKTRNWCAVKEVKGESVSFDRIGVVEMVVKPSRHAPTPNNDPNHERRWATIAAYQANILLDRTDLATVLNDPTSDYVRSLAAAIGRQWDRFVLSAAIGTATTGVTAGGTETWPFTDRKSVSHRIAEAGTTGMTIGKIRNAKRIFDVLMVGPERVAFVDAYALQDILESAEATSSDYNTVKALVNGEIDTWLGFKWELVDNALMTVASSIASGIFMERGAVGLGIGIDKTIEIDKRPDLSNAMQVYAELMGGAVRRDADRIIEVQYYQG